MIPMLLWIGINTFAVGVASVLVAYGEVSYKVVLEQLRQYAFCIKIFAKYDRSKKKYNIGIYS